MSNLYRGSSIDASYQVSFHLDKRFQRRNFFRNQPIRNKNGLWWPCLLTDRDEMSNLYRRPSLSTKFRFIWPSSFRGEDLKKSANQKQELPVAAMFVNGSGQNEQSLYKGPSIDASYQVSVHLAEGFQRRTLKCEKLTDDRRQVMAKAHVAFGKVS
jgi:hypothetical protein